MHQSSSSNDSGLIIPFSEVLWGSRECAIFLKYNVKYFSEKIASKPGFPRARRLKGHTKLVWKASEVVSWFDANSEAA